MPFTAIDPGLAEPAPATSVGVPLVSTGYTLQRMREKLSASIAGRTDITPQDLTDAINETYIDLCTSLDLDELRTGSVSITTVPGQALYGLPEVVSIVQSVSTVGSSSLLGGYPLDKIDLNLYRALEESSGEPLKFFRQGSVLVLWPTPNAARSLSIDFTARPLPLVNPTDSPVLGWEWHEAILLGARERILSLALEDDRAILAGNRFVSAVRRRTDRTEEEDSGRVIGSSVPMRTGGHANRVLRRRSWED